MVQIAERRRQSVEERKRGSAYDLLEGGNPNARHHGKVLERATFCRGVDVLTETQ